MPFLLLMALIFAMTGHSDATTWCVCRSDVGDSALQKALDYACGAGADCAPINQNGACYQPNTVKAHCSYAVNSYFQKKGQATGTCIFSNSATTVTTDPSPSTSCVFPSSSSTVGTTPTTTTPSPSNSTTPSILTPTTPSTGTGTGTGTGIGTGTGTGIGLGPSGFDNSDGGHALQTTKLFITFLFLGIVFLQG